MTITYELSIEMNNWTDGEELAQSTDYDALLKQFHEFLGECLMESVIGNNNVDYVSIESYNDIYDDDEVGEVCIEYTFNEPPTK